MGISQAFAADPCFSDPNALIGQDTKLLTFGETDVTKRFNIWNDSNDANSVLRYTLDINGADANYFYFGIKGVNEVNGESYGVGDKQEHTISVQSHSKSLIADIIIKQVFDSNDPNEVNDLNNYSYIDLSAPIEEPNEEPNNPTTSTVIGLSTSHITMSGNVVSKRFRIWNKGTEELNYTLAIVGEDSDYFWLDSEDGNSAGTYDIKTHTVFVDYEDLHNTTLHAQIEITDDNDDTAYIDLTATETIATRVFYVSIEEALEDGEPNFSMYIETDATVTDINFTTPEGEIHLIDEVEEDEETGIQYWYFLDDPNDFADFGDGEYKIEVTYDDNDTAETLINFGIPNKPGTIAWPTQEPVLTQPEYDEGVVSPVRLEWEKCTDASVNLIRIGIQKEDDFEANSIYLEYSKGTVRSSAVKLTPGTWITQLSFGKWYQGKNEDGIEYEVGRCLRSYSSFNVMKWFGTNEEDGYKNHTLKLIDCEGTEVTFKLTGGGSGEVLGDDCECEGIELTGTTEKSVLKISTKKSIKTNIDGDIAADGDIKAIIGRNVNLSGDITIEGAVSSIALNRLIGDCNININEPISEKITTCALEFGQADNLILDSQIPIRSLRAVRWINGSLNAPWISSLYVNGNFGADINLDGGNPKGITLKKMNVRGIVDSGWTIDGNCGSIQIGASTWTSTGTINGSVGTFKAKGNRKTGLEATLSGAWFLGSVKTLQANNILFFNSSINNSEGNVPSIGNIKAAGLDWQFLYRGS